MNWLNESAARRIAALERKNAALREALTETLASLTLMRGQGAAWDDCMERAERARAALVAPVPQEPSCPSCGSHVRAVMHSPCLNAFPKNPDPWHAAPQEDR